MAARNVGADVMNALDVMENADLFSELLFGQGDLYAMTSSSSGSSSLVAVVVVVVLVVLVVVVVVVV